jgi:hypothetical protein
VSTCTLTSEEASGSSSGSGQLVDGVPDGLGNKAVTRKQGSWQLLLGLLPTHHRMAVFMWR